MGGKGKGREKGGDLLLRRGGGEGREDKRGRLAPQT